MVEIGSLKEGLSSKEENERVSCAVNLRFYPPEKVIALYKKAFSDPSLRVRKAAVESLDVSFNKTILKKLFEWAGDHNDANLRMTAQEVIFRKRSLLLNQILNRISKTDDPEIIKMLIDLLYGVSDRRVIKLLKKFSSHPDPNVRAASYEVLGSAGDEGVRDFLLNILRVDKDPYETFIIIESLSILGNKGVDLPVGKFLKKYAENSVLRKAIIKYLGFSRNFKSVSFLLHLLETYPREIALVAESFFNLTRVVGEKKIVSKIPPNLKLKASSLRVLEDLSEKLDKNQRLYLLKFAILTNKCKYFLPVIENFKFTFEEVDELSNFFRCCGKSFGIWAGKSLEIVALPLKAAALIAAGKLNNKKFLNFISSHIKDVAREIKKPDLLFPYYLKAVTYNPPPQLAHPLLILYKKLSLEEKKYVEDYFYSLGRIYRRRKNLRRFFKKLQSLTEEESSSQLLILHFIRGLGSLQFISSIRQLSRCSDATVRKEVVRILGNFKSEENLKIIATFLNDESPEVRIEALEALSNYAAEKILSFLSFSLRDNNDDVKTKAISLLSQIGGKKEILALTSAINDPSPYVAVYALSAIANKATKKNNFHRYLIEGLYHKDEEVVLETLNLLKNFLWDEKVKESIEELKNVGSQTILNYAQKIIDKNQ